MFNIGWKTLPDPRASDVGPRTLWLNYAKWIDAKAIYLENTFDKINDFVYKELSHMQLQCDKCHIPYSLEEIACGEASNGLYGCGQKTLAIVHKFIDDKLVGKVRTECQNKMCGKTYYPPRERVATCEQHPNNNLSYLLNGNEQTELLPIMCAVVADLDIRSTTRYFQATCGSNSASKALAWMDHHGLVKKRRIGLHTQEIHDPYVFTLTNRGKDWLEVKMRLFAEHGLRYSFEGFVKYRNYWLSTIEPPEEINIYNFIKNDLKIKEMPEEIKKALNIRKDFQERHDGYRKALLHKIDSGYFMPKNVLEWFESECKKDKAEDEKLVLRKEGVVWTYKLQIPIRKGVEMEVRHVPSKLLDIIFRNDKSRVWGFKWLGHIKEKK